MAKKTKLFYIYHIPGKKIGVTRNLHKRVTKQQGYKIGEYEILFQSEDIEEVSKKEKQFQRKFGYSEDWNSFSNIDKQNKKGMSINTTEQTTTFPVPLHDLRGYLEDHKGLKWNSVHGEHELNEATIEWILKNGRISHFNPNRSYVYNKTLASFGEEHKKETSFTAVFSVQPTPTPTLPRFDDIRDWAKQRGLYTKGDVKTQFVKLQEETGELARAIIKNDSALLKDSIGDTVVVLTNLAHIAGLSIEDCIEAAYQEIKNRKGSMMNGSFVKETL